MIGAIRDLEEKVRERHGGRVQFWAAAAGLAVVLVGLLGFLWTQLTERDPLTAVAVLGGDATVEAIAVSNDAPVLAGYTDGGAEGLVGALFTATDFALTPLGLTETERDASALKDHSVWSVDAHRDVIVVAGRSAGCSSGQRAPFISYSEGGNGWVRASVSGFPDDSCQANTRSAFVRAVARFPGDEYEFVAAGWIWTDTTSAGAGPNCMNPADTSLAVWGTRDLKNWSLIGAYDDEEAADCGLTISAVERVVVVGGRSDFRATAWIFDVPNESDRGVDERLAELQFRERHLLGNDDGSFSIGWTSAVMDDGTILIGGGEGQSSRRANARIWRLSNSGISEELEGMEAFGCETVKGLAVDSGRIWAVASSPTADGCVPGRLRVWFGTQAGMALVDAPIENPDGSPFVRTASLDLEDVVVGRDGVFIAGQLGDAAALLEYSGDWDR